MMRRWILALLALTLLVPHAALGADETAQPTEKRPGIILNGTFPQGENLEGDYPDEPERLISAVMVDDQYSLPATIWMRIPDGLALADFEGKGVYFTVSKPIKQYRFSMEFEGFGRDQLDDMYVLEPDTIEYAGERMYGMVRVLTDDTLLMEARHGAPEGSGDEVRMTLTPDTARYGTIVENDTCEVTYDPDTLEVLWLLEAHG